MLGYCDLYSSKSFEKLRNIIIYYEFFLLFPPLVQQIILKRQIILFSLNSNSCKFTVDVITYQINSKIHKIHL